MKRFRNRSQRDGGGILPLDKVDHILNGRTVLPGDLVAQHPHHMNEKLDQIGPYHRPVAGPGLKLFFGDLFYKVSDLPVSIVKHLPVNKIDVLRQITDGKVTDQFFEVSALTQRSIDKPGMEQNIDDTDRLYDGMLMAGNFINDEKIAFSNFCLPLVQGMNGNAVRNISDLKIFGVMMKIIARGAGIHGDIIIFTEIIDMCETIVQEIRDIHSMISYLYYNILFFRSRK